MVMQKLESIQALRGIAVLGVIAFHAMTIERKYSGGDQLLPGLLEFGQTGVDLFFVISGFVMVTVTRGRGGRGDTGRFLWSRFSRIYPTYWFYYFLTAAVFLVRPGWVNAAQGHQVDLLTSFLLLPDVHLPLVMVAWSLIHELWFYLVFAVLLQFREGLLPHLLLLWAAAIFAANTLLPPPATPGIAAIIRHPFSLQFIAGAGAALLLYRQAPPRRERWTILLPAVLLLPPAFALAYHLEVVATMGLLRAATFGTLYAMLVYGAAARERSGSWSLPPLLVACGNMSYTLYLSHILVLSAVGRLWRSAAPNPAGLVDNGVVLAAMLVAVTGCGWLAYRLVERPALALAQRLRQRWFDRPGESGSDPRRPGEGREFAPAVISKRSEKSHDAEDATPEAEEDCMRSLPPVEMTAWVGRGDSGE
jgi:peptidoglycan/LPS O-acetylase OafA/YrhL